MEKDRYNTYCGKAYRFLSFEGLYATIESETLRFSRGDTFNDPLDMHPYIASYDWEKYVKTGPAFVELITEKAFDKIFSSLYVCCFCKEFDSDDSTLMWSHYAKNHTQVCFEIDFSHNNYLGGPSEVYYSTDIVADRKSNNSKTSEEQGLYLVTTKIEQWKYEKEVRLVVDTRLPKTPSILSRISVNELHLFVKFDLHNISKVIFGVKANSNDICHTMILFANKNIYPEFFKMIIDPVSLKLRPVKINFEALCKSPRCP